MRCFNDSQLYLPIPHFFKAKQPVLQQSTQETPWCGESQLGGYGCIISSCRSIGLRRRCL